MAFTVRIETDNAAFEDANHDLEIARILRALADRIEGYGVSAKTALCDVNGNRVGSATADAQPTPERE